ncbi:hypothetical protein ACJW30_05G155400 [Castanea mollissima]
MQSIRISVLRHVRVSGSAESWLLAEKQNVLKQLSRQMCSSTVTCPDQIMDRVIGLVKKFDKIDASKVTKTADFQKDLSLDSLDRVELIMAFEQEFSLDIPDEKADKLTCCADVAKYIVSGAEQKLTTTKAPADFKPHDGDDDYNDVRTHNHDALKSAPCPCVCVGLMTSEGREI